MGTTGDVWFGTIHESSVKSVWRVNRVFSYMMYIDSNHRESRILISFVCDSHHVDNLTDLMSLFVIDVCCLIY
jgi:hypothetical protein